MPCVIEKEHTNFAKVSVISKKDFSARPAFLAKFNNTIAHGETITEAMLEAKRKFMSNADFSEQKKLLLSLFEEKKRLTVKDLSEWHGAITGSCSFGRREFQSEHNLKDEDLLSLDEFVELVKDSYGGNKIADLIKD